jgi:hypothetical protein
MYNPAALPRFVSAFTAEEKEPFLSAASLIVEAHGQRSSKTSSLFLYRGSRIMELDACGLKLEASTVGLEACCLELEACGLTLETLIV